MATTADFKNGLVLKVDGKLQQIVEFQHVKPGKGPAFVRTKLKDVVSGKTVEKTWNAGVKVETATVDRRDMTYLYNDGTSYVVMDDKTFEQFELPADKFGDAARFLLENMHVQVSFHEGEAASDLCGPQDRAHRAGSAGRPFHRWYQAGNAGDWC